MRGLPPIASAESHRVRRWDAVILGGALPGLVAAVRIARGGHRVLLLEEKGVRESPGILREPFLLTGAGPEEVLGACLRALGVPLIDQRRLVTGETALQIALPNARVDVGRASGTVEELVAWGLAKPEPARRLLSALGEAGDAERRALLQAPIVRAARRLPRPGLRGAAPQGSGDEVRGLPEIAKTLGGDLGSLLDAVVRALSNHGGTPPSDAARARLLGGVLDGGVTLAGGDEGLLGMVRRRFDALHGESRSLGGPLRFVSVANQPGLSLPHSDEIWAGRALVLNAPRAALAAAVDGEPPDLLRAPAPSHARATLHLRGDRAVLPEAMADRLVRIEDPAAPIGGTNAVCVRVHRGRAGAENVDIMASAVVEADAAWAAETSDAIERAVRAVLPFSEGRLARQPQARAEWDGDQLLVDPRRGAGWPQVCDVRLSSRPSVFCLERGGVAGLGLEGDLLLGWRAGDAIAADLT
jgi:hypothetical protein